MKNKKNPCNVIDSWKRFAFLSGITCTVLLCCSQPNEPEEHPTLINGTVKSMSDSSIIANANVIVYDATTNAPVTRAFSSAKGTFSFEVVPGTYYLKVAAQGYISDPLPSCKPLFFQVTANLTYEHHVVLTKDTSVSANTSIAGSVKTVDDKGITGVLIVAQSADNTLTVSTTSGPDGLFVLYNVPAGNYSLQFYKAGYQLDSASVPITATAGTPLSNLDFLLKATTTRKLNGKITFLASNNSVVDITLIHPISREAIPGLFTFNDPAGLTYELTGIPEGTYIVWASYRNDGYVMDPDWISKNGLPTVTFSTTDTLKIINFSVTDAINVLSPTNPSDSAYPTIVNTTTPLFKWTRYPQSKEIIIEVSDIHGKIIWGGYDTARTILHQQISALSTDSIVFNFDNSAIEPLMHGKVYRWKIYADDAKDPNIQTLISSSEDLKGLFMVDTMASQ